MILALDISLNVGWALGTEGNLTFGTRTFQAYSHNPALCGRHFRRWMMEFVTEHEPTDIIIERPFFRGVNSWLLSGLAWEVWRVAELRNLPMKDYHATSIKKHVTGSGRAKKPEVMKAIRERGYKITNDHEADAVGLLLLHESKR